MPVVLGEIIGWEALLVLGLIALLFGSAQLPKLARSIGSARSQFHRGVAEAEAEHDVSIRQHDGAWRGTSAVSTDRGVEPITTTR